MKVRLLRFVIFSAVGLGNCTSTAYSASRVSWAVGQEKEVDEGYFFTLAEIKAGWRLWRIETKSGVECRAVKSAVGRQHPIPLGFTVNFTQGEPFIVLYWSDRDQKVVHFWQGQDIEVSRVQTRMAGEKFWSDETRESSYADGAKLEVNVISWEYPKIYVGYHEARGAFDLSGLDAMKRSIEECRRPLA